MNINHSLIMEEYDLNQNVYKKVQEIVLKELEFFTSEANIKVNSVDSRIKARDSLSKKLERKGDKYHSIADITDVVGFRIVTFYNDEVDKYAAKVEKTFDIDWENSIDKRKIYNVDQFGYLSLHYICSIPKEMYYDEKNPTINTIRFEIQIRSLLQHALAVLHHDTGYKSDVEIPIEYQRRFARLAGLLELVDDEFSEVRHSIEEYKKKIKNVVKDGTLENVELTLDSYQAYIENGGFASLNERIALISNMDIEEVSLDNFLQIFKAFEFKTLKALDDFKKEYSNLAYEFCVRQFSDIDLDIITSAIGPLNLCIVYALSKGLGAGVVKRILDLAYGDRKTNVKMASKLLDIGKSMGIYKD